MGLVDGMGMLRLGTVSSGRKLRLFALRAAEGEGAVRKPGVSLRGRLLVEALRFRLL
jgi:hypothetical protein